MKKFSELLQQASYRHTVQLQTFVLGAHCGDTYCVSRPEAGIVSTMTPRHKLVLFKAKPVPLTRHGGAWEESKYSSYSFLTSALDGGEWSASRPVLFG
jgi:hypothetical protein